MWSVVDMCKVAKNLNCPTCTPPAGVEQGDCLPSHFSSQTINKYSFHSLFSATFFAFLYFIPRRQRRNRKLQQSSFGHLHNGKEMSWVSGEHFFLLSMEATYFLQLMDLLTLLLYWSIVAVQRAVRLSCAAEWFRHAYTHACYLREFRLPDSTCKWDHEASSRRWAGLGTAGLQFGVSKW